jgi:uncharacterized protein involved in exopolysaccharide biosynthesis
VSDDVAKLRATLAELHAELESIRATDPEIQELLGGTLSDIQAVLQRQPPRAERGRASIVGRLADLARQYEDTHPTLSGLLGSIIDTLSRMGI